MAEQGDTVRGVPKTVAIVGAGPSGLAACKAALEEGLLPTVFETAAGLGGLWRSDASGKVWNCMRTNLSKYTCAFSDQPWPAHVPDFPAASEVEAYLRGFAEDNGLLQHIRFGARVVALEPSEGVGESRCTVTWEPVVLGSGVGAGAGVDASGGGACTESFDFGVVASGVFSKSHLPDLAGLRGFAGQLSHASAYREPGPFEGKRVLVVGAAFSGADIAADIATTAASVVVAARRPMWYLPRYIKGRPADLAFYSRAGADAAAGSSEEERSAKRHRFFASVVGDVPASVRLPDPARGDVPFVAITDGFLDAVRSGRVAVRAESVVGLSEGGAIFSSGAAEDFDAVVLATGYRLELPFLPPRLLEALEYDAGDWLQPAVLHECVWHPACPSLAFVGLYRGPYFAAMELQARWACGVFSGRLQRPGAEELERGLQRERDVRAKLPRQQFPHGDYVGMVEALARRVGVHPQQLLNDSSGEMYQLLYKGPLLPFHYRLVGFQSKPEVASRAIRECVTKHPLPIE